MVALDKVLIQIYRSIAKVNPNLKSVDKIQMKDIINCIKGTTDSEAVFYCSLIVRYHPYMWKACENSIDASMDNRYKLKWCLKNKTYVKLIDQVNSNIDTFNKLVFKHEAPKPTN